MSSEVDNGTKLACFKIKISTKPIWTITRDVGRQSVYVEYHPDKNNPSISGKYGKPNIWRLEMKGNVGSCCNQKDPCVVPKTLA